MDWQQTHCKSKVCSMNKRLLLLIFTSLFFQLTSADSDQLKELIAQKLSNPKNLSNSISSAKEKSFICTYCHGIDGNSPKEYIPNLAAQNPEYIAQQLLNYASDDRNSITMGKISKELSLEDKANISIYFSKMKLKKIYKEKSNITIRGENIFNTACFICHDQEGKGNKNIPRIAKQKEKYISDVLSKFKSNKNYRPKSPMFDIAEKLSNNDINALAAYISRMHSSN